MGKIEKEILEQTALKPLLYLRYIDDIFMIYQHGQDNLLEFIEMCNNHHETIKFTAEYSSDQVVFLDTIVHIDKTEDIVYTSLYTKPTDTHSYLRYDSAHPRHCKNAGPYGQLLRVKRNCYKDSDFLKEANTMLEHYRRRGYPEDVLQDALAKSISTNRSDLLKPKGAKPKSERPVLVLTYHPKLMGIQQIVHKFWSIIQNNHTLRELFPERPLIAFRRNKTLGDSFVSSTLVKPNKILNHFPYATYCDNDQCAKCPLINKEGKFSSHINKRTFSYRGPLVTCTLQNVVYMITCQRCGKQYVGETKRESICRIKEHRADIRHNRNTPVAKHFNLKNHSIHDFSVQVIEHINKDPEASTSLRRGREHHWIFNLQTVQPLGLNLAEPN